MSLAFYLQTCSLKNLRVDSEGQVFISPNFILPSSFPFGGGFALRRKLPTICEVGRCSALLLFIRIIYGSCVVSEIISEFWVKNFRRRDLPKLPTSSFEQQLSFGRPSCTHVLYNRSCDAQVPYSTMAVQGEARDFNALVF